jgi:tetratricopeptide (TPR) repeat protein
MKQHGFAKQGFSLHELHESITALIATNNQTMIFRTLQQSILLASSHHELMGLAGLVKEVPFAWWQQSVPWASLGARILCQAGNPQVLADFLQPLAIPELEVYRLWVLQQTNQFALAGEKFKTILESDLADFERGLYWRIRANLLFETNQSLLFETNQIGWLEAFAKAKQYLIGLSLGRALIDEGHCLEMRNEHLAAQVCWEEALALLEHDAWHAVRLHYNLGLSCARNNSAEAEQHFLQLERLTNRAEVADFKSRAWAGLGLARRALGEYDRAIFAYEKAVAFSATKDDQRQAHRGLGHTLRLKKQYSNALKEFEKARLSSPEATWLYADSAATHLQRGDLRRAKVAILKTGELHGERFERAAIIKAEIARLEGDANQAMLLLKQIKMQSLWAREEALCFPELFALGKIMKLDSPKPLESHKTRVDVHVLGTMQVLVNGRRVPIKPTARIAEVLALLLHHNKHMALDQMLEALFKSTQATRDKDRKSLWVVIKQLRTALGWQESVLSLGSAYALCEQTDWVVHPSNLARVNTLERYLDGIHSDWALEINQELQNALLPRELN